MSDKKNWKQKGIALIPFAVGLPLAAGIGLYVYVLSTMTPLHPSAQDVASIKHANPLQRWTGAVEQARQVVRADLTEQNLPGVSVAVGIGVDGIGGEFVWAERFGWADLEKRAPVSPETVSPIGTASTALTSAAVGLLLEQGRLKLDDEIQTDVPAFPAKQWPVTVR